MPNVRPRGGNQQLPPWMAVHHLPVRGVVSSRASLVSAPPADGARSTRGKRKARGVEAVIAAETMGARSSSATNNLGARTAKSPVVASKFKDKKQVAVDSLHPPTYYEIERHIRQLDKEGARLALGEVDGCVAHSLRYLAAEKGNNRGGGAHDVTRRDGRGRKGGNADMTTLAEYIREFLNKFQPEEEDEEDDVSPKSNAEVTEGVDVTPAQRVAILHDMIRDKYNPELLPLITIKCHPNVLDRGEMTRGLLSDLFDKKKSFEPQQQQQQQQQPQQPQQQHPTPNKPLCPTLLKSVSPLVRQGHLVAAVLSQCISHDPDGEAFAVELQRKRKRQRSRHSRGAMVRSLWSWTDSLVEWGGHAKGFGSIVVILEDPENIPSPTLDSFLISMASLRSDHHVPISIVVVDATPGGLADRLSRLRDPALRGTAGVAARELHVPSPQVQLDLFFNRLFSEKCLPTFLWTDHRLLNHVQLLFQECDNSVVSVGRMLKAELRRYFSVPGAFTSLLSCEKFVVPNESRITWLFGDEQCRKVMSSNAVSATPSMVKKEEKHDGHILVLFWKMQVTYLCHQLCQRINVIFDLSFLGKIGHAPSSKFCSKARLKELLLLLGYVRQRVTTWRDASVASSKQSASTASLCNILNEYIVLVGTLALEEGSDPSISRTLVEDIAGWATHQFSVRTKPEDSPPVQPRRDVARSLSLPPPAALADCTLVRARSIAFRVFQTRVTTLADWHGRYLNAVTELEGDDAMGVNNETAFFFAVHELVHCGFVRRVVTGRREEAYEKVAMVWGSGR